MTRPKLTATVGLGRFFVAFYVLLECGQQKLIPWKNQQI